jgi:hypothetical protein
MREVTLPKDHRPYILFESRKPSGRKPSAPQQRILDQMRPGVWYEPEWRGPDGKCKDRSESCNALVGLGRCIMARIAKKGPDGKLFEPSPEELLLEAILSGKKHDQPLVMYRLANVQSHDSAAPADSVDSVVGTRGRKDGED